MKVLLDTNALIWWFDNFERLGSGAYQTIADPTNEIFVSMVSFWEIAIKSTVGKIAIRSAIEDRLESERFVLLPITLDHVREVKALPLIHRDPFDRMLIAQAKTENLVIVTADRRFAEYDIGVMPA